jgi:hypothetical protein
MVMHTCGSAMEKAIGNSSTVQANPKQKHKTLSKTKLKQKELEVWHKAIS